VHGGGLGEDEWQLPPFPVASSEVDVLVVGHDGHDPTNCWHDADPRIVGA
jgi:hypothetical protein